MFLMFMARLRRFLSSTLQCEKRGWKISQNTKCVSRKDAKGRRKDAKKTSNGKAGPKGLQMGLR
jgi:hypothetical protein